MELELWLSRLPKTVIAVFVLVIGVGMLIYFQPPHSICDTYRQSLEESTQGILTPKQVKKYTYPPKINEEEERCRLGASSGACHDYLMTLRNISRQIRDYPKECQGSVQDAPGVRRFLSQGVEKMVRMAWGDKPPEPGPTIAGWMQEFELSVFCSAEEIYKLGLPEGQFDEFKVYVYRKLPGPMPKGTVNPTEPPPITESMTADEIWKRSLFSVNCQLFL